MVTDYIQTIVVAQNFFLVTIGQIQHNTKYTSDFKLRFRKLY
jgi:hypothetical protein